MAVRTLSKERRLARLARLLRAPRAPFYVSHPVPFGLRREYPCEGWYWIPPDGAEVQLLARDSYDAYHRLMTLIEQEDHS